MLIIEGADHLGKTTASKSLVKMAADDGFYPIRYSHMSRPNGAFDFLDDYQDMSSKFAVQDRFHLGGMVWHEGKITHSSLKIIEGRLMALGSFCVVMFTSDEAWYRDRLTAHAKSEMFPIDAIMNANRMFKQLAEYTVWCDILFDVKDGLYPTDIDIKHWLDRWYERLQHVESPRVKL